MIVGTMPHQPRNYCVLPKLVITRIYIRRIVNDSNYVSLVLFSSTVLLTQAGQRSTSFTLFDHWSKGFTNIGDWMCCRFQPDLKHPDRVAHTLQSG